MAYCFDEAVAEVGGWIEGELEKIDGKTVKEVEAKRRLALTRLLGGKKDVGFSDPAALVKG